MLIIKTGCRFVSNCPMQNNSQYHKALSWSVSMIIKWWKVDKKNEPKKNHMICNEPQEIAVGRNASFKDPSSHEKFP